MTPISQQSEPPSNPERFRSAAREYVEPSRGLPNTGVVQIVVWPPAILCVLPPLESVDKILLRLER